MSSYSTKTSTICCLLSASFFENNLIFLMTIPDLRDEIIIIILQILDVETAWLMVVLKGWKAMSKQLR